MKYSALVYQIEQKKARIKELLAGEPTPELVDEAAALDAEVAELEAKAAELRSQLQSRADQQIEIDNKESDTMEVKTIGELFTQSDVYTRYIEHKAIGFEASVPALSTKTTMTTTAGWAPFVYRLPRVGTIALAPNTLLDIIPVQPVATGGAIKYMREITLVNAAAPTKEADAYGEAALQLNEITCSLRKIAVWLPVTEEQLADVDGIQAYINNRLGSMLTAKCGAQLFHGSGSAPQMDGLDSVSGVQSVVATGFTNVLDAVAKAIQLVRSNGMVEPSHIVVTPKVWYDLTVAKASTAGLYLWGDPNRPGGASLWGIPLVVAPAFSPAASGNASIWVGDFTGQAFIAAAPEVSFAITDSHASHFAAGIYAIRASVRMNLGIYRPTAFCKVTNIALS